MCTSGKINYLLEVKAQRKAVLFAMYSIGYAKRLEGQRYLSNPVKVLARPAGIKSATC